VFPSRHGTGLPFLFPPFLPCSRRHMEAPSYPDPTTLARPSPPLPLPPASGGTTEGPLWSCQVEAARFPCSSFVQAHEDRSPLCLSPSFPPARAEWATRGPFFPGNAKGHGPSSALSARERQAALLSPLFRADRVERLSYGPWDMATSLGPASCAKLFFSSRKSFFVLGQGWKTPFFAFPATPRALLFSFSPFPLRGGYAPRGRCGRRGFPVFSHPLSFSSSCRGVADRLGLSFSQTQQANRTSAAFARSSPAGTPFCGAKRNVLHGGESNLLDFPFGLRKAGLCPFFFFLFFRLVRVFGQPGAG